MTEPDVLTIITKLIFFGSIVGFVVGAFLRMRK